MPQIYDVSGRCPVCTAPMTITRLSCAACGTSLDGSFRVGEGSAPVGAFHVGTVTRTGAQQSDHARFGRLARLDSQQLEFVETFLRCRGVIKNVEDMLGISYPTVKARLANVLETMGMSPEDDLPPAELRARRRQILADLAAGRITTEEAHRMLARNALATERDDEGGDDDSDGG